MASTAHLRRKVLIEEKLDVRAGAPYEGALSHGKTTLRKHGLAAEDALVVHGRDTAAGAPTECLLPRRGELRLAVSPKNVLHHLRARNQNRAPLPEDVRIAPFAAVGASKQDETPGAAGTGASPHHPSYPAAPA